MVIQARRALAVPIVRWPTWGTASPAASLWRKHREERRVSDDKSKTGGQDRTRISLQEDYEVRDWAKRFGVSEEVLRAAVERVGDRAEDVEKQLGRQR